ncbi:MAG: cobalamin B12-binding domain-containing protein [Chloroflexaceae bacterium]
MERKIRVLVAKPGLDGHDRGAKVIARALRDAGMEVIYTGLQQTPQMIVEAALQEDVDVIGLSILSGAHMALLPRVMQLLQAQGMDDLLVVVGGIIPDEDAATLTRDHGIAAVFGSGASTHAIVRFIQENMAGRLTITYDVQDELPHS